MSESVSGDSGLSSAAPAAPASAAPADTSSTPVQSAPTTQAPAGEGVQPSGEPPKERWPVILENARKKAAEDAEAKYAWAKGLTPEQVQTWRERNELIERDPHRFHKSWNDWYTQAYGLAHAQPPAAPQDAEPQPDLQAENGELVYSAKQQRKWAEWSQRQQDAKLQATVQPLQQFLQAQQAKSEATRYAKTVLEEARTWEGFGSLEPSIRKRMSEDKRLTLHTAYQRAFKEEYLPTLKNRQRQELLDEMNKKATATTASPNNATVQATPLREKSWEDVLRHFAK